MGEPLSERLFLGVALSDEVRHGLAAFLQEHAAPLPGKPVPPQNWHVTLRFLGATEDPASDRVLAFLDDAPLASAFILGFGALGAFARPARATVLWLATDRGSEALTELAASCEDAAQNAGFAPEDRPFHPHLTLSRIRPWRDVSALVEQVPVFPLSQSVDRITLYRSVLGGGGGARYEVVDEVALEL